MKKFTALNGFNQVLLFIVLLFVILSYARTFLIPIAVSGLMAMLLVPVCRKMESWKIRRGIAAAISVVVTLLIISGVIYLLINELISLSKGMDAIGDRLTLVLNSGHRVVSERFNVPESTQKEYIDAHISTLTNSAGKYVGDLVFTTTAVIGNLLIITVYTVMMLIYRRRIKKFVLQLVNRYAGRENVAQATGIVDKITGVASSYVAGIFLVVAILSVLYFTGLTIIGIENALFFAILAALINVIPYIGSVAGGAIVVAYTLLTRDTLTIPIIVTVFFTVIQQLDSYVLTPKITGGKVQLSPLFTIMVLLLGALVWGAAGMILFIPFLGILKVIFDNVEALEPYGYLIGDK